MPKKKKLQAAGGLGRSIIKDRFGKNRKKMKENSSLHTTELDDGYEWGRLNLQSVTEQSTLDDFLTTAALAGTEFNAEKLNVKFIDPERSSGLLSEQAKQDVEKVQEEYKSCLKIPRRPLWDELTTPEELDRLEKDNFLKWRRELALLQEKEHLVMTPFEKNLEFWRQLWRVIERSDIIVQIVDARNPLLFRCEDLEVYVKEVNPNKVNAILVNKADLLSQKQRDMWADYFSNIGVQVLFWSAMLETEKLKVKKQEDGSNDEESAYDDGDDDDDDDNDDEDDDDEEEEEEDADKNDDSVEEEEDIQSDEADTSEGEKMDCIHGEKTSGEGPKGVDTMETCEKGLSGAGEMSCESGGDKRTELYEMDTGEKQRSDSVDIDQNGVHNSGSLLSGTELLEALKDLHHSEKYTPGQTTIGLVGYPNVGKSSTINAILEMKKVPVSATPGRTKHFQTLYVEQTLMLCDCPGLVMPSFVSTKADMVISGILPIDQMRDYIPPVARVCQLIPRKILEEIYGINIRKPREGEDPHRPPTAHELLTCYGYARGFMTHKGIPDLSRASRYILKDFVNGKLRYCHPPPEVDLIEFEPVLPPPEKPLPFKHKGKALRRAAKESLAEPQTFTSEIDQAFFAKSQHKVRSKGVHGVEGYKRVEGLATHLSEAAGSEAGSISGSVTTINGKPWKRHNNRQKKEKLRRKHVTLDQHDVLLCM
ncbi:large subunit GTPase 1 homolog [Lineus longissimus]|uniref:large subunit GTPase 1 homolog n=1 Tax=Lineus longissimus TaxID=88925 RepID=UPI002B4DF79B